MIDIVIHRVSSGVDDTIGELYDEYHVFFCNTLEDEGRKVKVKKETRIWAGRYKLGIQQAITPLTQRYLDDARIPFFERHIEILNVEGFKGVYIHIGNDDEDTDACVLLGHWANRNERRIVNSVITYSKFYQRYYPIIKQGADVYLNIYDS